jgi:SPP1 gp7 family putative phage head morphogenesis protein
MNSIIIPYQLNRLDQAVVEDLKIRNLSNVTKLTEDMKTELLRTLTEGIRMQQSTQSIMRAIHEQIPGITRARAKTIARTEISYSYNTAQAKTYQSIGLDRWQWLAALGYNCCDECTARHGNVYDWGDEQPPLHPNCLCTIYPIVDKEFPT